MLQEGKVNKLKMRRLEYQMDFIFLASLMIVVITSAFCDADKDALPWSNELPCNGLLLLIVNMTAAEEMYKPPKVFVWYASYGSNMDMQRFLCYIEGGQVEGMHRPCDGSLDKTRPADTKWGNVSYRMFFGRQKTKAWGPGGVAFLDLDMHKKHLSHVRMYKISLQQFNDLLKQENSGKPVGTSPLFTFADIMTIRNKGHIFVKALKKGWYRTILYIGDYNMLPVLTFTCPPSTIEAFKTNKLPICPPSKGYKDILIKALVGQGKLPAHVAVSYIRDAYQKPLNGSHGHSSHCIRRLL